MRTRVLSVLHSFVALNAVGGGIYGLTGAAGVPVEWLEETPFSSYLIPSLILLLVVGGTQVAAGLTVAARARRLRISRSRGGFAMMGASPYSDA